MCMLSSFLAFLGKKSQQPSKNLDFIFLETLLEEAAVSSCLGIKRPQYRLMSIQISIAHLQGLCSDWWKVGFLLTLNLTPQSMRFLRPGERDRMWLRASTAAGWSPGLVLALSLACAVCPCHCTKDALGDVGDGAVPEDAQMLQDLVLSYCLSWGWWTTKNAAQCSEGCIVRAAVEPWTDPTYTLCYVCGLCLFLPFFWVPSLALIIAEMVWKPRQGSGQHCCASPFCRTGTEILGAPCGTCISLLSLVTQKPWKSLLLFLSQTLFQHL